MRRRRPEPLGRCSREAYTGDLRGSGDTAFVSMTPVDPPGLTVIAENEVLHLADGELHARVNAVFNAAAKYPEFSSMHTITGGTGRYAGASGFIQLTAAGSSSAATSDGSTPRARDPRG